MKYEIKNRFTGAAQIIAEIDCAEDARWTIKLGMAAQAAVKGRANLTGADLGGANLRDADLKGAYLGGADLRDADLKSAYLGGADLGGADLRDADLKGEKIERLLASAQRTSDGYTFMLFEMQKGPSKIVAGCRFLTSADYAAHVAKEYPDTAKARETLRILDYFDDVIAAEVKEEQVQA